MRKKIDVATIILLLTVLFLYTPQPGSIVHGASIDDFTDVTKAYWGRPYIGFAADAGIINGYPLANGRSQFKPEALVSQEESMQMIYKAVRNSGTRPAPPVDFALQYQELLAANQIAPWAYECVSFGLEYGIVTEAELDGFRTPAGAPVPASRVQVARWTAKAIDRDFMPATALPYPDERDIPTSDLVYVDLLARMNIMVGDNTGKFYPKAGIKRVEFAVIATRVYDLAKSPYDSKRENRSFQGTVYAVNPTANQLTLTLADGTRRVITVEKNMEIVIDGVSTYNGLNALSVGQKLVVAWGPFPQVLIQTQVMIGEGTVKEMEPVGGDTTKLAVRLTGGTQVYYLLDGETSVLAEPRVGRSVLLITDGVKILEITSP